MPKKRRAKEEESVASRPDYVLSTNSEEDDRLVAQHYLLRMALGGTDYHVPSACLQSAVVLDIGCGSGAWTMEMATAFPRSTFIGIDPNGSFPQDIKPKNCHFRQCKLDPTQLPFPDNSFDYIYQRDLNWGLSRRTWRTLMAEYHRILKPGGWIEVVEQDLETQSTLDKECALNDRRK